MSPRTTQPTEWFDAKTGKPVPAPADALFLDESGYYGFLFQGRIYNGVSRDPGTAAELLEHRQARAAHPVVFEFEGVRYRSFPDHGAFFGVKASPAGDTLMYVPMQPDGQADTYEVDGARFYNAGPVSNMAEDGDGKLLELVNAIWSTQLSAANFE